ncbi:Nif3-like dinuclear metal center hexameric protein [Pseudomonadota bacterium]
MVELSKLVEYCDELLQTERFRDYAPNGLQIEGERKVSKIVTGVTASKALIDAAIEAEADVLMVHHGFFWKGESSCITGLKQKRIAAIIKNNISLVAYHLPLDAHEELGNNALLGRVLELQIDGRFGRENGDALAMYGELNQEMNADELALHIKNKMGRTPLHLKGASEKIKKIAWCSGAAQGYIEQAYELGVDAFISGEVSENTTHFAKESGVHYFAAGHHATERYGVKALGDHCANVFNVGHEFIDIDNPV